MNLLVWSVHQRKSARVQGHLDGIMSRLVAVCALRIMKKREKYVVSSGATFSMRLARKIFIKLNFNFNKSV